MGTVSREPAVEHRRDHNHHLAQDEATGRIRSANLGAPFLTVSEWRCGESRRLLSTRTTRRRVATTATPCVISVEVEFGADVDEVLHMLQQICDPEICRPMVEDLLDTDDLPKVHEWPGTNIRSVSAVAARATAHNDVTRCDLEFDVVELLSGPNWIVVSCHTQGSYGSRGGITMPRAGQCDSLFSTVESRWVQTDARTSGDLGVLVLDELARTYHAARRSLMRCIDRWERSYLQDDGPGAAEGGSHFGERLEELIQLRGSIGDFRDRLGEMNVERDEAAESWFNGVTIAEVAARTDERIDTSLDELDRLREMIRASLDLMHSQTAARQLELSRKQQESAERVQTKIELITSIFLVPTLIAGIFGANTALPGGNSPHQWLGFEFMFGAMLIGAIAVFMTLRHLRRRSAKDELATVDGEWH